MSYKLKIKGSLLAFATTAVIAGLPATANASPICAPEYERLAKIFLGSTVPNAKYCVDDCIVAKREISDAELDFILTCEKIIDGRWNGDPLPATPLNAPPTPYVLQTPPALPNISNGKADIAVQNETEVKQVEQPHQPVSRHTNTYKLGGPTTPNSAFPYPVIALGEIWVPGLKWQNQTTIVNTPLWADRDKERPVLPVPFDDMIKANRGEELIKLLSAYAETSQAGRAEVDIQNIYKQGLGGVAKNESKYWEWLNKSARKSPFEYQKIGDAFRDGALGQVKDIKMAAHYWSVGLSRGCRICGARLENLISYPPSGSDLPFDDEAYFRYLVFTYDLGERNFDDKLAHFESEATTPKQRALFERAADITGTVLESSSGYKSASSRKTTYSRLGRTSGGGIAVAVREQYRTGLVSEFLVRTHKEAETADWVDTAQGFLNNDSFGRYRGVALSEYLARDAAREDPQIKSPAASYLAREALRAGELSNAPMAAYSFTGISTLRWHYGKNEVESITFDASLSEVAAFMNVAILAGLATEEDSYNLQSHAAMNIAETCWREAASHNEWGIENRYKDRRDARAQSTMIYVHGNDCFEKAATAEVMTGERFPIPDYVAEYTKRNARISAETMAAFNKKLAKEQERKAAWATPSRSNSYISATTPGSSPASTISSADAYSKSKASVCSYSTTKTRFCR